MPKMSKRGMAKAYARANQPSKFWSTELNPGGASIGNFIHNIKTVKSDFVKFKDALTAPRNATQRSKRRRRLM